MNPRILAAVILAVLAVLWPHLAALAVITVIAGAVAVLGIEIFTVTSRTGWGVVPVRRSPA